MHAWNRAVSRSPALSPAVLPIGAWSHSNSPGTKYMTSEEVFIDDYAMEQTSDNLVVFISPSEPLPARPASHRPAQKGRRGEEKIAHLPAIFSNSDCPKRKCYEILRVCFRCHFGFFVMRFSTGFTLGFMIAFLSLPSHDVLGCQLTAPRVNTLLLLIYVTCYSLYHEDTLISIVISPIVPLYYSFVLYYYSFFL